MRGGKFLVMLLGLMLVGTASAETKETMRPIGIKGAFISKPVMVKQLYRTAWQQDNGAQMSLTDQIEYFQEHNPGFDEATMDVIRRGVAMMKKMDLGLENQDLTELADQIQKNPAIALDDFLISDKEDELDMKDALEAADMMDSAEKLKEKMYQNKALNQTTYQIDIDAF